MVDNLSNTKYISQIVELLESARRNVLQTINHTMVATYFEIGRIIVEEEQNGKDRAEYGKGILKELSNQLTKQFGKGFSETNLKQMRQFYLNYSIGQTLSDNSDPPKSSTLPRKSFEENSESTQPNFQFNLSWSHYIKLMRIEDEMERKFYEI